MSNYFRITGYYPKEDLSFIIDSNGMFEKLWQFSSYLIQKGLQVLEVSNDEKFEDINIVKVEKDNDHIFLRATCKGKPIINDNSNLKTVGVGDKNYIIRSNNG